MNALHRLNASTSTIFVFLLVQNPTLIFRKKGNRKGFCNASDLQNKQIKVLNCARYGLFDVTLVELHLIVISLYTCINNYYTFDAHHIYMCMIIYKFMTQNYLIKLIDCSIKKSLVT